MALVLNFRRILGGMERTVLVVAAVIVGVAVAVLMVLLFGEDY